MTSCVDFRQRQRCRFTSPVATFPTVPNRRISKSQQIGRVFRAHRQRHGIPIARITFRHRVCNFRADPHRPETRTSHTVTPFAGQPTVKLAYLVEVTALVSAHSRLLIEQSDEMANSLLGDYYVHSRNRFNRWMRDLNDLETGVDIRDPLHLFGLSPKFPLAMSITEQILVNDLLNRVWTVILVACDRHRTEDRIEPLAHNVFRSHLTVRHKALSVCMNDQKLQPEQVLHINKLRTSSERWADLLNCSLMAEYNLWDYAFDEIRAREFYQDRFHSGQLRAQDSRAWSLILAGLRHSFPDIDGLAAPVHDDDRLIVRSIIDCFPGDTQSMAVWSLPTIQRSHQR